jgi:hypothetical protein
MTTAERKTVKLSELFTDKEVSEAMKIIRDARKAGTNVNAALLPWIRPHMPEIDRRSGQENNASFMGYVLEAAYDNLLERR